MIKLKNSIVYIRREFHKEWWLVAFVMLIALALRLYKISEVAIFLSDQAIDSYAVKNILEGNFTLLGPRASVGNFFNGPAVYYLMLPFYYVMKLDPLAGTYFQIFLQIITIPLIYLLGKRIGTNATGYLAAAIFSFSPLFIYYSKSAFNSYPALFLTTCIIYFLTFKKKKVWHMFVAGLLTGILVQAHYLLYIYALLYFAFVALQKNAKIAASYVLGTSLGVSPFLLFEVRHGFFNTAAILAHIANGSGERVGLFERLPQFLNSVSQVFGYSNAFVGVILLAAAVFSAFSIPKNFRKWANIYTFNIFALLLSMIAYGGFIQTHYTIGFQPVLVLLVAYFVTVVIKRHTIAISLFAIVLTLMNANKNFVLPKEQDRFGLVSQRKVVNIIKSEIVKYGQNTKWNITQDLQQDNRAMPLRYLLSLEKDLPQPLPVEDYSSNSYLFLILKSDKDISHVNTWEFRSFGDKYSEISKTKINNDVDMHFLEKVELDVQAN